MTLNNRKYFVSFDENGIVDHYSVITYSHSVMEYSSEDKSITNNSPRIGSKYDPELNAFIPPKPDDETYIFNTETFMWEPDPNVVYYIDNLPGKWNPETKEWYRVNL